MQNDQSKKEAPEETPKKDDEELDSEELDLVSGGLAIASPIRQACPPVCITSTS
jgi:hypothetical protein